MTAVPVAEVDPVGRRDEWLALRRRGIGGSDVPAILGLDRFRSPFEVYLDKVGELTDQGDQESPAIKWGRKLEDVIADEFGEQHPDLWMMKPKYLYRHPDVEWMLSNPDRLVAPKNTNKANAILEVKSSRLEEDWKDGPPDRVKLQALHYCAVHDYDHAHIAILLHGRQYADYLIERDLDVEKLVTEQLAEFWQRVQDRRPPPVDGTESTTEALKQLYAHSDPSAVADLTDAHGVLIELRSLKARRKALDEQIAAHENEIKHRMGTAEAALYNGEVVATWKPDSVGRVDTKAMEREHPTLVAAYRGEPARRFLLKKEK